MATSVVFSSIFAAVMASLPGLDTSSSASTRGVVDLTELLEDPVDVLFGVSLSGGTDINRALAYCEGLIRHPPKTHMILISDLAEGGDRDQLLARAASLVESGVNLVVLLALSDDGRTWHDEGNAKAFRVPGARVPRVRVHAGSVSGADGRGVAEAGHWGWAAERDIALVRG